MSIYDLCHTLDTDLSVSKESGGITIEVRGLSCGEVGIGKSYDEALSNLVNKIKTSKKILFSRCGSVTEIPYQFVWDLTC